jgi:hypothetical protein
VRSDFIITDSQVEIVLKKIDVYKGDKLIRTDSTIRSSTIKPHRTAMTIQEAAIVNANEALLSIHGSPFDLTQKYRFEEGTDWQFSLSETLATEYKIDKVVLLLIRGIQAVDTYSTHSTSVSVEDFKTQAKSGDFIFAEIKISGKKQLILHKIVAIR